MKKFSYISFIILLFSLFACSEDFLDRKNLYDQLDENFYSNPEDIGQALTAAYSKLAIDEGRNNYTLIEAILDDDHLGGGAVNDLVAHGIDEFTVYNEDEYQFIYAAIYEGIFRANMIIANFDQAVYDDETEQNRDLGEAYFLRGYFYLRLARMFGSGPLIIDPAPVDLPKAEPAELFGQIISDLQQAIELLPATPWSSIPVVRDGHATKWAAEGILARAFLFYTGYYNASNVALPDGGTVTSADVLGYLEDCIANSGHGLLDDFRNLWPYSVVEDYPYNVNEGLSYAGERNREVMFTVKYSSFSDFNLPGRTGYSNQRILYQGLRFEGFGYEPFGAGWGWAPVHPNLWEAFEEGDLRRNGSILSLVDNLPEESNVTDNYPLGGELGDLQKTETGYWSKKYLPVVLGDGADVVGYYFTIYGGNQDKQHWNMQDDILLRYADILLMAAELGSSNAQTYFDDIRERAGLGRGSKTVSLEAIKQERRVEFAGEGLRYYDLLRWGDAQAAFNAAAGITVYSGAEPVTYNVTFNPDRPFLKFPETQVRLSPALEQYPGWQ